MNLTKSEFTQYAKAGYRRVPLAREVIADLDTPLSLYLKLAQRPYSYLFESVQGGEKWGRYSMIGLPCRDRIVVRGNTVQEVTGGKVTAHENVADPLQFTQDFLSRHKAPELPGLPRFCGGLVGYFGYETIAYIEPHLAQAIQKADPIGAPDILLMVSDEVVVFDNLAGKLYVIVHADPAAADAYDEASARIGQIVSDLYKPVAYPAMQASARAIGADDFVPEFPREKFTAAVERCREYIRAGDIFQVVLAQRQHVPFKADSLDLYRALRTLNPSPYMFYMHLDDICVVGASPEILARLEDDNVTVRPIAGTRPRGQSAEEDVQNEKDLLADPKECAEHIMLVDLGRNDVGRVAETGSVRVTEQMVIERYSHVMHIVSNVTGKLRPQLHAIDVLRASFPAGTVSGAPKVRALEIIQELELTKRGIYGGAVGYLSWTGNMDTAIAIRTAVIKDETLYVQAGAGIVADSVPEKEWTETMSKANAIFCAAATASAGHGKGGVG